MMFQNVLTAIETPAKDIEYFKQLPKSELHLHLGGAYPLDYLLSMATSEQGEELKMHLDAIAKGVAYQDVFRIFQIISQIVNTEDKLQKGVEAVCASLQEDGVVYLEMRTGLKNFGNGVEEYLKAVLKGMEAKNTRDFKVRLLLSLQRNSSPEMAKTTVDLALKYQKNGIIGIDISGDSTTGQIEHILPELMRAKNAGLSLVVHIGEAKNETDQLRLLMSLQPDRVGHGVHLTEDARAWILKNRIPLEVCLTSSVLVQMIETHEEHPGLQYFKKGHPIAICTDDPLLFSTTLSKEFHLAHHRAGLSIDEIEKIIQTSFDSAIKDPQ